MIGLDLLGGVCAAAVTFSSTAQVWLLVRVYAHDYSLLVDRSNSAHYPQISFAPRLTESGNDTTHVIGLRCEPWLPMSIMEFASIRSPEQTQHVHLCLLWYAQYAVELCLIFAIVEDLLDPVKRQRRNSYYLTTHDLTVVRTRAKCASAEIMMSTTC